MASAVKSKSVHNPMQKIYDPRKPENRHRRKAESKPKSVNQLEQRRALRHVQSLHQELKMPVPQLPAVLTYLRWLDKMDEWTGRGLQSSVDNEQKQRSQMYSWSGDFGNPIALPNIKKYPNSEKFSSAQLKEKVFNATPESASKRKSLSARDHVNEPKYNNSGKGKTPRQHHSLSPRIGSTKSTNAHSASPRLSGYKGVRYNGKPTPFYTHAKEGFQYWPVELYKPPVPHTKYSFGERFNPGRFGVITDRIYAEPRSNKHYWTDFQLRQNPIGSGNSVTGSVLRN